VNPGPLPVAGTPPLLDEASLQRALDVGHVVVWKWDLATGLVTCSHGARDFFGVEIGTLDDFQQVFHPDDLARVAAHTLPIIERGGEYAVTYRLRRPGQEWRWVQSHGRVEAGMDGLPAHVLGTTVDISAQVQAERATRLLADAGEVLNASLDVEATLSALAGVVVPEMADWFALDLLDERNELRQVAVVHPDPARVEEARELNRRYPAKRGEPGLWQAIETGEVQWAAHITDEQLQAGAADAEHLRLLRSLKLQSYIILPLIAHGSTLGVLTLVFADSGRRYGPHDVEVARDLARRAAVAVDNARLFEQLQLADRRKDEFLAMLAHELRNPLAPISTAAQLLRLSSRDAEVVCQASEIIGRQIAHMTDLVDDLLDVSRVTRGLIRVDRERLDLRDVVAAAVEQVHAGIMRRSQRLEQDIADEALCVEGDAARLVQVVANLLANANKYTPPGGRISVRAWGEGDQAMVSVDDTGCGIEPALLPHVFELFTQGRRTPDRTQGGLGIGLALVCSIVRLHDGQIDAQSEGPGQGSRFVLRLPRVEPTGELPKGGSPTPVHARPAAGTRFLVVDDNADAARSLAQLLRTEGYEAVVAFDAEEALRAWREAASFDVCVLDIGLPDMTGHELARRILATAQHRPLLVALTGYGQPEDRDESLQAGFDHHLVKPVDLDALLDLVAAR
jgi:signal transduction histidine kinase